MVSLSALPAGRAKLQASACCKIFDYCDHANKKGVIDSHCSFQNDRTRCWVTSGGISCENTFLSSTGKLKSMNGTVNKAGQHFLTVFSNSLTNLSCSCTGINASALLMNSSVSICIWGCQHIIQSVSALRGLLNPVASWSFFSTLFHASLISPNI